MQHALPGPVAVVMWMLDDESMVQSHVLSSPGFTAGRASGCRPAAGAQCGRCGRCGRGSSTALCGGCRAHPPSSRTCRLARRLLQSLVLRQHQQSARLETRTEESMELAGWQEEKNASRALVKAMSYDEHTSAPDGCRCAVVLLHGTPDLVSSGRGFECWQVPWDPKGGELYCSMTKPWETVVEVSRCPDVQIAVV